MGRWVEIEHTADLALHVWGQDLADLFTTAAQGMFSLLAEPGGQAPIVTRAIRLAALDVETLLVDWLNELLYFHEVDEAVYWDVSFSQLSMTTLAAEARGVPVGERRAHIKAVTFHNLAVVVGSEQCEVELVFDV